MEELKCRVHGLSFASTCSWCSDPICEQCLLANNGRKYCVRCYMRLTKNSVADFLDKKKERYGEKPTEKILNIDPSLDEEEVKKRRKMLDIREKAKSVLGRIEKHQ
ncbi:MAG: hypothetical protein KJ583_01475 [Nanoarchaeota archaeon]|nr:hypothetical protein [Nanoarchaeota archaeon]MBU1270314.1 hypothetical protein [Nanoarchaeota archaeon]MBU1603963.1 hypothetical protein [Nanoarchaeota archaeon]MBU2443004.1 hypothetical protein [Nanoarchaeota archaeon]